MIKKNLTRAFIVLSALLLSFPGCYGQEDVPARPAGKWIKTVNERSVTFTLYSDLKYEVDFVGSSDADVNGTYEITGTQITFHDKGGDFAADVPGVYEFQVDEASLSFTKVNDPVTGRSMMVEGTWQRVPEP